MRRALILTAAILAAILALGASTAAASTATEALNTPYSNAELFRPCDQLGTSGFGWNCPTPADAKVDPTSPDQRKFLTDQLGTSWEHPGSWWFSWFDVYTVDASTPLRTVCFSGVVDKDPGFMSWENYVQVHKNFVADGVPIPTDPSGTLPALDGGSDQGATIWQPGTGTVWDLYLFRKAPDGTTDPLSGKTCDFLVEVGARGLHIGKHENGAALAADQINPGYYRQDPPREFSNVARRAAKTPVIPGNVTPQEWNHPDPVEGFGHKLQATLPWTRCIFDPTTGTCSQKPGDGYQFPAHAMDAWSPWGYPAIREGAIIRFNAQTDCTIWDPQIASAATHEAALYWERVRGLCVTMKRYGAVGTDQTGNGFAFNFAGGGATDPDGGGCCDGKGNPGMHWPNQYIDPIWAYFRDNLEVLEEPAHVEWTPGCEC